MNDEQIRRRLMTTLSAAVRIGRSGGLTDSQVGAELQDLADLYLASTSRNLSVPAWQLGVDAQAAPAERKNTVDQTVQALCGFSQVQRDGHTHRCDKAQGHDDGPGGSDHQCESCGCLYDAAGGMASPLGMAGLPLGGNGPVEEQGAIEL